jgi:NAD(P)-dependent dehydrogenase (short-subunit alcohol dehydrogenase family)
MDTITLITGANRGIGREVCRQLAALGHIVILTARSADACDTWQRAVDADLTMVREAAETNLYGPWLMVQEFLPLLRRGEHGRIVNVSSEAASLAHMGGGTPAYTASKTALNALTRMLADELRAVSSATASPCRGESLVDLRIVNQNLSMQSIAGVCH